MDVGLELGDVAGVHLLPGGRHDLHHADGAGGTLRVLIEPRFLVAQRHHQQIVELVPGGVLLEDRRHLLELLPLAPSGEVPEEGIRELDLVQAARV